MKRRRSSRPSLSIVFFFLAAAALIGLTVFMEDSFFDFFDFETPDPSLPVNVQKIKRRIERIEFSHKDGDKQSKIKFIDISPSGVPVFELQSSFHGAQKVEDDFARAKKIRKDFFDDHGESAVQKWPAEVNKELLDLFDDDELEILKFPNLQRNSSVFDLFQKKSEVFPYFLIDAFMFNGEDKVLGLRLEILKKFPQTFFVAVESECSFKGHKKVEKLLDTSDKMFFDAHVRLKFALLRVPCSLFLELQTEEKGRDKKETEKLQNLNSENVMRNSLFDASCLAIKLVASVPEIRERMFAGEGVSVQEGRRLEEEEEEDDEEEGEEEEETGDKGSHLGDFLLPSFVKNKLRSSKRVSLWDGQEVSESTLKSRALVSISDVDEIIRPPALASILSSPALLSSLQDSNVALVFENLRFIYSPLCVGKFLWRAGVRVGGWQMLEKVPPVSLRSHQCTDGKAPSLCQGGAVRKHVLLRSAWHFSFFMSLKEVKQKYSNYAISESNWIGKLSDKQMREHIRQCRARQKIAEVVKREVVRRVRGFGFKMRNFSLGKMQKFYTKMGRESDDVFLPVQMWKDLKFWSNLQGLQD